MEELLIIERKMVSAKYDVNYYQKQNKKIKLYFAKKKLKKLQKQYETTKEKVNNTIFYKK